MSCVILPPSNSVAMPSRQDTLSRNTSFKVITPSVFCSKRGKDHLKSAWWKEQYIEDKFKVCLPCRSAAATEPVPELCDRKKKPLEQCKTQVMTCTTKQNAFSLHAKQTYCSWVSPYHSADLLFCLTYPINYSSKDILAFLWDLTKLMAPLVWFYFLTASAQNTAY